PVPADDVRAGLQLDRRQRANDGAGRRLDLERHRRRARESKRTATPVRACAAFGARRCESVRSYWNVSSATDRWFWSSDALTYQWYVPSASKLDHVKRYVPGSRAPLSTVKAFPLGDDTDAVTVDGRTIV